MRPGQIVMALVLAAACAFAGEPAAPNLLKWFDRNGDGALAEDELPERLRQRWGPVLKLADTNHDGKIDAAELAAIADKRKAKLSEGPALPASLGVLQTVTVGGLEREYIVYAPKALAGPAPLVLVFHGGGGNARSMTRLGFNTLADKDGFVAAYPHAIDGHWNDGRDAALFRSQREKIDDVAFVRALVDAVAKQRPIDRSRVFATGVSNGGIFCHRLAADASDLVAAVAPVIGGMAEPVAKRFAPEHPVSLLVIQGDADPLVPIDGGYVARNRGRVIATQDAVGRYLTLDGILGQPAKTALPDSAPNDGTTTSVTTYPPGPKGFRVQVYISHNGGHQWPGSAQRLPEALVGKTVEDFKATDVVWRFFQSCPSR